MELNSFPDVCNGLFLRLSLACTAWQALHLGDPQPAFTLIDESLSHIPYSRRSFPETRLLAVCRQSGKLLNRAAAGSKLQEAGEGEAEPEEPGVWGCGAGYG